MYLYNKGGGIYKNKNYKMSKNTLTLSIMVKNIF